MGHKKYNRRPIERPKRKYKIIGNFTSNPLKDLDKTENDAEYYAAEDYNSAYMERFETGIADAGYDIIEDMIPSKDLRNKIKLDFEVDYESGKAFLMIDFSNVIKDFRFQKIVKQFGESNFIKEIEKKWQEEVECIDVDADAHADDVYFKALDRYYSELDEEEDGNEEES